MRGIKQCGPKNLKSPPLCTGPCLSVTFCLCPSLPLFPFSSLFSLVSPPLYPLTRSPSTHPCFITRRMQYRWILKNIHQLSNYGLSKRIGLAWGPASAAQQMHRDEMRRKRVSSLGSGHRSTSETSKKCSLSFRHIHKQQGHIFQKHTHV